MKLPSQSQLNSLSEQYQNGQYKEAEELALSITQEFPNHQFSWKVLGAVLGQTGRKSEALNVYQRVVQLVPEDAAAHYNLGVILEQLGRTKESEASYRQAIALKPDSVEAHYNLGFVLQELGRLEESEASYRQAIVLKPDSAEAHYNLGNALKKLGRIEESEVSYTQAIVLKPDYAEAHNNLGNTLRELGRLDEAEASYREAINIRPNDAESRFNLNNVSAAIVPSWHSSMINDEPRNRAYLEAIKLAVDDGFFVLEIGTGSGLLSMMAAASGAGDVISCESSTTIANVAKKIISRNGYEKNINVINKKSTELIIGADLPRKADLLISEILSAGFVGEGVRSTILDANTRLLKKDGRMIPESGDIRIALVGNNAEVLDAVLVSGSQGFDLSEFNSITQRQFSLKLKEKPKLLSNPEDAFSINLYDKNEIVKEEKIIKLQANQSGLCLGLIQWLRVQIYKDIQYENNPGEIFSHWPTPIYMFDNPVEIEAGQILEIRAFLGEDSLWFYHLA